jgi:hypothetical protein
MWASYFIPEFFMLAAEGVKPIPESFKWATEGVDP